MKRVAVIGIQGVPARYGGFETLVENMIGKNCSGDVRYTVFCSKVDMSVAGVTLPRTYNGAELRYIPFFKANGIMSIPYDIVSMMCCVGRQYDDILVLGVSGCVFLPLLRLLCRGRIIVNIDGLEHKRDKWGRFARWFLRASEKVAVKYADIIVSDNEAIKEYVTQTYDRESVLIAYGGDHALVGCNDSESILKEYGIKHGAYAISVCRIEPENNVHVILESFAKSGNDLVFVGNWNRSEYGRDLYRRYSDCPNIRLFNPIYDLKTLFALRSNASMYIHGHSAGGTNPSLVEAMHFSVPIIAYDCIYNRATTHGKALYFRDSDELGTLIQREVSADIGAEMASIACSEYRWADIAAKYELLYR